MTVCCLHLLSISTVSYISNSRMNMHVQYICHNIHNSLIIHSYCVSIILQMICHFRLGAIFSPINCRIVYIQANSYIYGMFLCYFFSVSGCMLCLVRYLFVISTSVIDCLGRLVSEMTCYVSSGTLNLTN